MLAIFLAVAFFGALIFVGVLTVPFVTAARHDSPLVSARIETTGPAAPQDEDGDRSRARTIGRQAQNNVLRMAAIASILTAPVVTAFLYMQVGSPHLLVSGALLPGQSGSTDNRRPDNGGPDNGGPDNGLGDNSLGANGALDGERPTETGGADAAAIAAMSAEERAGVIDAMVARLAARLEENPADIDGWRGLARAQAVLQRHDESARSLEQVFALTAGDSDDWRNYAATFIAAAPQGVFPTDPRFVAALDEIETREPGDIFVRFYRGGAARESDDFDAAGEIWQALRRDLPATDGLRDVLDQLIAELPRLAAAKSGDQSQEPVIPAQE